MFSITVPLEDRDHEAYDDDDDRGEPPPLP